MASDENLDGDPQPVDRLLQWRRRGPIGRLHNLNAAISNSPQHLECLLKWPEEYITTGVLEPVDPETGKKRVPLRPIADSETRWNSRDRMMVRTLLLRRYFNRIVEKSGSPAPHPHPRTLTQLQ